MGESTKERIIEAAFSFYKKPMFENVSLSQIAQKVGVSKAAIFKHFANKDDLSGAMDDRLYESIAGAVSRMMVYYQEGRGRDAIPSIIDFLVGHRTYLFYLLSTKRNLTEDSLLHELSHRGVKVFGRIFNEDGSIRDFDEYFVSLFVSTTMIVFIMGKFQAGDEPFVLFEDTQPFAYDIDRLIQEGLSGRGSRLDEKRMDELDAKCQEGVRRRVPVDKVFLALSSAIASEGFQKLTIEKIADELGLAKSSLYSVYENKLDLITKVIRNELCRLFDVLDRNMEGIVLAQEKRYILFQTLLRYVEKCPQLLSVMQSLFSSVNALCPEHQASFGDELYARVSQYNLMGGVKACRSQRLFVSWLFVLPCIVYMHCHKKFTVAETRSAVRNMYCMAEYGVKKNQEVV